jgi:hypothetical protein
MTSHANKPSRNTPGPTPGLALTLTAAWLLSACASTPVPPGWQANAFASLNSATQAYLSSNTRVATFEFDRARAEIARTGRPDLMARAELLQCAAQVASLNMALCTGYLALAADATTAEKNYARFMTGDWAELDPAQLPVHYQGLVAELQKPAPTAAPTGHLTQITDPLAQLIAASMLLKKELITQVDIGLAVDSASKQGWSRPLLAWLGIQLQWAQRKQDGAEVARIQRRMDLIAPRPASLSPSP